MAVYTDDFSTDPASRWTRRLGDDPVYVWDSGNAEMDLSMVTAPLAVQYNTGPGSIEHEAQATWLPNSNPHAQDMGSPCVRMQNAAASGQGYVVNFHPGNSTLGVCRLDNAGGYTAIGTTTTFTSGYTDWISVRLAATGGEGAEVTLSVWATSHGGSKPTDPGWLGSDGSPLFTRTDSATSGTLRHDDSAHGYCGIGSRTQGSDFDTRHTFWKARNISDRAGGSTGLTAFVADQQV